MYETAFRSIDNHLRRDDGPSSELDYVEQTSWVLFLKYLHDLESEREDAAALDGRDYVRIIDGDFAWDEWAAPRGADGQIDHDDAETGPDLIAFVDNELFPHLAGFRETASGPDTIEYKIGEIFSELRNRFRSGFVLRDVIEVVDGLSFNTSAERHELSDLYEQRIKRMGNAGRNGGEYYTPRPLIRAIIQVIDPKIGETLYDGACGSAGFLCEAYDHMRRDDLSAGAFETLQRRTLYGQEKKSLAYVIGVMNMVLHGLDAPNIRHANTLAENVMDIGEDERHDVVLANPPFGGGERAEVQHNFPIRSGETAYLFLQHFIRKLKPGGRAGVVIKNTFLTNTDNASVALRRELLERCDLHTVLDCPSGTFQGAGVKTVVLFFVKGAPTRKIWFYQLDPGRNLGKTNALADADLTDFLALQPARADGPQSWTVRRGDLDEETLDLGVRNPNAPEAAPLRAPHEIIDAMLTRDAETAKLLDEIRGML
ncbi:MAG: N-6 DNA methylase [Pseudomonadota bacterium]